MRRRLLAGASLLVLGGCSLFLGLDDPTYDGPLKVGDGGNAEASTSDAPTGPAVAASLDDATRWSTYAKSGGGYVAGPFDGRFIYFLRATDVDGADAGLTGARVLRYDTQSEKFDDDAAWTSYDMEGPLAVTGGHVAAVMNQQYLVIGPRDDAKFIRYDTSLPPNEFGFDTNWQLFDGPAGGYFAALPIDDGGLLFNNGSRLTPVEHTGPAFDAGWQVAALDAGTFGCANTYDGMCTGGQLFFGPGGGDTKSCLARYDLSVPFGTNPGWDSVDVATLGDENAYLDGIIADGQHNMYVTQYSTHDAAAPVRVFRRPAAGNLDAGWESQPTNVKNPLTRGFVGGVFDGRYMYFAPYPVPTTTVIFERYDTTMGFGDPSAWTVAAGAALGIPESRFWGAVFDGQYVYYPSYTALNGSTPTFARFKAYDTKIAVPPTCR